MSNDTYVIDLLATGIPTVTVTDDGSGKDWLKIIGVYEAMTDIRLSWYSANGVSTSATGYYFSSGTTAHRLVVEGLIENVRGSNGADFIQGNEVNNVLFGDNAKGGPGGADVIWGFAGNDIIYGGSGEDEIDGGSGNDRLYGGPGADVISGGADKDTIEGGGGPDVLYGGGSSGDTVAYFTSTAGVRVSITYGSATKGVGGHAQGDTISGFSDVIGSAHDDVITDTNSGTLAFGYNDNAFWGGDGGDRLYLGGGNDRGYGDAGSDRIFGGLGDDQLFGGDGADLLYGGIGRDQLTGGADADRFIFTDLADSTLAIVGRDVIMDFSHAEGDRIDLRQIDARPLTAGDDAFTFVGTGAFTGAGGELRVRVQGSDMLVYADIDGDTVADFSILVKDIGALDITDFLL